LGFRAWLFEIGHSSFVVAQTTKIEQPISNNQGQTTKLKQPCSDTHARTTKLEQPSSNTQAQTSNLKRLVVRAWLFELGCLSLVV
jgi:hypothetical protein